MVILYIAWKQFIIQEVSFINIKESSKKYIIYLPPNYRYWSTKKNDYVPRPFFKIILNSKNDQF